MDRPIPLPAPTTKTLSGIAIKVATPSLWDISDDNKLSIGGAFF